MAMVRKQKDGRDPNHYLKEQEGHGQEVPGTQKGQVTAQNLVETKQQQSLAAGNREQLEALSSSKEQTEFRTASLDFSYKLNLTTEV